VSRQFKDKSRSCLTGQSLKSQLVNLCKQHFKLFLDTAFKQQRLKAWQPILTPKAVIPTFLLIGAIFIPVGIGLLVVSNNVII
jgi:hypothetical protein